MWIVKLALQRPYTFIVLAVLIALFGVRAALTTPTDIFPNINLPVVSVVWTYTGMLPRDMSGRVVYFYERTLTTQVNDIEHIESQSIDGRAIIKAFFQPTADVNAALVIRRRAELRLAGRGAAVADLDDLRSVPPAGAEPARRNQEVAA